MPKASHWAGLVAGAVLVGGAAVAACNDTTAAPLAEALKTDAQPPCPATLGEAPGASCTDEGATCSYLFPCTPIASSVTCACQGGQYACAMPDGGALDASACPALTTTASCPASEVRASGLFCNEPGLICTYPSACASTPAYDSCQCVGGRTDAEVPHFQCTPACELLGDASAPPPPPADAEPDASPPDAATPDDAPDEPSPDL